MKLNKKYLLFLVPAIIAIAGIIILISAGNDNSSMMITGVVEASDVDVSSKIPGRLDSVYFKEGDIIKKGDIIAKLESKEMDAKVGQARGLYETAEFKYKMTQNGARPEERVQSRNNTCRLNTNSIWLTKHGNG